jgi:hypothetical protein
MKAFAPVGAPVVAVLLAAAAAGGCVRSATYGTGQAPEMALFTEVTGGLLARERKPPIQYGPRAPLVLPPSADQLPPPVETAAAASADWPIDPDQAMPAADIGDEDPRAGGSQAEYRRLRPLAGLFPERPRTDVHDDSRHDEAYDIVHSRQQRREFQEALAEAKGYGRTERRYLTDPPESFRDPAPTAPVAAEPNKKKRGFFLTRWLTGG